jgi:hypothetical protein
MVSIPRQSRELYLVCTPLKAAKRGRSRPRFFWATLRWLINAIGSFDPIARLLLLIPNVLANHCFIPPNCRNKIPSRQKTLPNEISPLLSINSCQMNRAFPLDIPNHLRDRVFWWNRDHHVYVIRHQMTFFDPTFFLLRQAPKHLAQILPQFFVQRLSTALRYARHMVIALPLRIIYAFVIAHLNSPFRSLGGSRFEVS